MLFSAGLALVSLGLVAVGVEGQGNLNQLVQATRNETLNDQIPMYGIKPITITRLDPIVTPNATATHMHLVVGGSAFGPNTDYESARSSSCSTMPIQEDLSNYWTAPLAYIHENNTFSFLVGRSNVTYFLRPGSNNASVVEFPPNFQMLGGNSGRRTLNLSSPSNGDNWVWYECVAPSGEITRTYELPQNQQCALISTVVNFPWCWNGRDLTTGRESTHVAYGGGSDWPDCLDPAFPVRLPRVEYSVTYDLSGLPYRPNALSLATGDQIGYTLHSDFLNGWRVGYLVDVLETRSTCRGQQIGGTNGSSVACQVPLADVNVQTAANCVQQLSSTLVVDEQVGLVAPIPKMPGCNIDAQSGDLIPGCSDPAYTSTSQPAFVAPYTYYGGYQLPLPANQVPPTKSSTNVGAIVRGVIGGVAFLLLSLLALLFFLRRRRRSKEQQYEPPTNGRFPPTFGVEPKTPDVPNPSSTPTHNHFLPEVQSPYETSSPHSQARHSLLLSASPPPESNLSHSTSPTLVDRHASPGILSSSGSGDHGGSLVAGRFSEGERTPPGSPMSAASRGTDQRRSVWSEGEGRFVNEVTTVAGRR